MKNLTSATVIAGAEVVSLIRMLTIGNQAKGDEGFSLYIHIPFCTKKCDYCHFYVIPEKETHKTLLLEGLKTEWDSWLPKLQGKKLVSIYFGGGTPYLFGPDRVHTILNLIKQNFDLSDCEISLEANPENITLDGMRAYQEVGINRVSIGLQSLEPALLQILGRTHTSHQGYGAVELTYKAGISNISVDLMYDLPNQTLAHWMMTLKQVRTLPITHLSLYNLTFEPHTLFFKKQKELKKKLPDSSVSTQMYLNAVELLEEVGLQQYEISAFAKNGLISRHNTGYWMARPFLGFGPSAFSYWEGKRFRNIANLNRYYMALKENQSPIDFEEQLEKEAQERELFVIAIRLMQGAIPTKSISQETLHKLMLEGYLEEIDSRVKLTKKGVLFYDTVASALI